MPALANYFPFPAGIQRKSPPPRTEQPYRKDTAIDEVRAGEARELKAKGYEPVLKGSRWLLLKRPSKLTGKQETHLEDLLQYNLTTVRSYLLKEDFQFFWDYISPTWAARFMDK